MSTEDLACETDAMMWGCELVTNLEFRISMGDGSLLAEATACFVCTNEQVVVVGFGGLVEGIILYHKSWVKECGGVLLPLE